MNQTVRDLGSALFIAVVAAGLVLGALALSRSEGNGNQPLQATEGALTANLLVTLTQPSPVSSATSTPGYTPTNSYFLATSEYQAANPAYSTQAYSTRTYSSGNCGAAYGWVNTYIVQPSDTLYMVASMHYTTVSAMQKANCLGTSTTIYTGNRLWVPYLATRTPEYYLTYSPYPTEPFTETVLPFTETVLPFTLTPAATESQVP
jgi:LysM repeat protein